MGKQCRRGVPLSSYQLKNALPARSETVGSDPRAGRPVPPSAELGRHFRAAREPRLDRQPLPVPLWRRVPVGRRPGSRSARRYEEGNWLFVPVLKIYNYDNAQLVECVDKRKIVSPTKNVFFIIRTSGQRSGGQFGGIRARKLLVVGRVPFDPPIVGGN